MDNLTYSDFKISGAQAVIFTPDGEFSTGKIMSLIYPKLASLFDGEPTVLPHAPNIPQEIPLVILKNNDDYLRFEIAPGRVNFFWRKTTAEQALPFEQFSSSTIDLFSNYLELTNYRIGRLAMILTRFAEHNSPGLFLSRHFCKEQWEEAPFDSPQNFEIHAHKTFTVLDRFNVNSWARCKSGHLELGGSKTPIVLFEQDINTLVEEMSSKSFNEEDIRLFFTSVNHENELVLKLYFPNNEGD